jgi:hydrogenase nickel incorporation protein HypA/HybF
MHEFGIVQTLIDQAVRAAGGRPVRRLQLAVGELSGVSPEALELYFGQLSPGTPLAGAGLVVRCEPGRMRCLTCGAEAGLTEPRAPCPCCGGWECQVIAGDAVLLEALDVD